MGWQGQQVEPLSRLSRGIHTAQDVPGVEAGSPQQTRTKQDVLVLMPMHSTERLSLGEQVEPLEVESEPTEELARPLVEDLGQEEEDLPLCLQSLVEPEVTEGTMEPPGVEVEQGRSWPLPELVGPGATEPRESFMSTRLESE